MVSDKKHVEAQAYLTTTAYVTPDRSHLSRGRESGRGGEEERRVREVEAKQ